MSEKIRKKRGFFPSKKEIFTFLKAQASSQMASWVDNLMAFGLKKVLDIFKIKVLYFFSQGIESYVFATVIGQICGGFFVCIMNWRWSFKSRDIKFKYILSKFVLVWLGSLFLNTYFTFLLTEWLKGRRIIEHIFGYHADDVFIFVKLSVSLLVGFFWNYTMYHRFVYKDVSFDKWFKRVFHKKSECE
ncbi:MAG: GtrA family protein [Prevotellaceae bacterium]|jgi:putative flippase GtrA|nr:GtrA family protein [Prevotellaceae bacterium]